MCFFHRWEAVSTHSKWTLERCEKCGKEKWIENFPGGYQPRGSKESIKETRPLREGFVKKGGLNGPPTTSRPSGTPPASKPIKE